MKSLRHSGVYYVSGKWQREAPRRRFRETESLVRGSKNRKKEEYERWVVALREDIMDGVDVLKGAYEGVML